MRTILKMILGLAAGSLIGLLIGLGAAVLFSGKTWTEAWANLTDAESLSLLLLGVWALVAAIIGFVAQIVVHEAGHLVAGLLTGYRFVSFRVFEYTLTRRDGHFRWNRFALGATGGQCLMRAPERPLSEIDTRWYNAGGVLANILLSILCLLLCCFSLPKLVYILLVVIAFIGFALALTNGIPMKIGGMNNDGYNLLNLERQPENKRLLCQMLDANASIQDGMQPGELPEDMFRETKDVDWSDALQANWQLMRLARMENLHQWDEAYQLLSEALRQKKHIVRLIQMELESEMVFVCLATDRIDEAREHYAKDIRKYVQQFAKTQSSKQRILFAVSLLMDHKKDEALQMLESLKANRQNYLLQGEVAMDINLMEWMTE